MHTLLDPRIKTLIWQSNIFVANLFPMRFQHRGDFEVGRIVKHMNSLLKDGLRFFARLFLNVAGHQVTRELRSHVSDQLFSFIYRDMKMSCTGNRI